jgi:hypothetical protein
VQRGLDGDLEHLDGIDALQPLEQAGALRRRGYRATTSWRQRFSGVGVMGLAFYSDAWRVSEAARLRRGVALDAITQSRRLILR